MTDQNWKEVQWPDNVDDSEIIEFLKRYCIFSVDINTKDPLMIEWIYSHKDWIKTGKE